jgi:hypothetical protein
MGLLLPPSPLDPPSLPPLYLVINWIDSKAMFADAITFSEHQEQFLAYQHRYGRGLVIYWHGYCEEILSSHPSSSSHSAVADDLLVVRDKFPDEWIFPTGEPADGRLPEFDSIIL